MAGGRAGCHLRPRFRCSHSVTPGEFPLRRRCGAGDAGRAPASSASSPRMFNTMQADFPVLQVVHLPRRVEKRREHFPGAAAAAGGFVGHCSSYLLCSPTFVKPLQGMVNIALNARIKQKAALCISALKAKVLHSDAPYDVDVFV